MGKVTFHFSLLQQAKMETWRRMEVHWQKEVGLNQRVQKIKGTIKQAREFGVKGELRITSEQLHTFSVCLSCARCNHKNP
jgi:hypothetical protein